MRTAKELRTEIDNSIKLKLEQSITDEVKVAWETLEDIAIENEFEHIHLGYNIGSVLIDTILNSNCFDKFIELLRMNGYDIDAHYDTDLVLKDDQGLIFFNSDAKVTGYDISW